MQNEIIRVNAGAGYDIHIREGLLDSAGELIKAVAHSKKAAVVTDTTVARLYGERVRTSLVFAGFDAPLFAFPAGEFSKNHGTLLKIYTFLAQSDITRADLIVALGGGVAGDTAGYAAATWQRGIPFVQIPTTLLAQVDSSIGGKTAVDLPEGKNLVGAFWQPSLVLCDPQTLSTLDRANIACGMAEIIKHACIRSSALFDTLLACGDFREDIVGLIAANLTIKRDIVQRDERERGERMLLNFGHTLGHAIEKLHGFTGVSHGEAVAAGMAMITRRAEKIGLTRTGTAEKLSSMLRKYGLPDGSELPLAQIVEAAKGDKKRAGGDIHLVLLEEIGKAYLHTLPVAELPAFFGL